MAEHDEKVPVVNADGDVMTQVRELTGQIQEISARQASAGALSGEDRERMERLTNAITELNKNYSARTAARKSEFPTVDPRQIVSQFGAGRKVLDELHRKASSDAAIREFQRKADDVYLTHAIMSGKNPVDPRSLECYQELMQSPVLKAAVAQSDIGAAGDGWYPVEFSAQLHELVRLARRVAALHTRIPMPTDPYKMPIEGTDAEVYVVPEKTGSEDYVASGGTLITATKPAGMTNLTLSTKKIGARLVSSTEAEEASIIPLLPYLRQKLVRAMSDAEEDATINGDTDCGTTAAMDADMQQGGDATNPRAAWNGYRSLATSACKIAVGDATQLDIADLRAVRLQMGKFGINPADLVYITGPVGYSKLLGLGHKISSTQFDSPVLTLDKYGPSATILTGELAKVDGIPIIVSEYVREDLSITGANDGVTTDRTMILCVNRSQFIYGDFRRMTLNSRYVPDTDQNVMVVLQKLTFNCWFAASPVVGYSYNIKK